jgi:hypothetical protein
VRLITFTTMAGGGNGTGCLSKASSVGTPSCGIVTANAPLAILIKGCKAVLTAVVSWGACPAAANPSKSRSRRWRRGTVLACTLPAFGPPPLPLKPLPQPPAPPLWLVSGWSGRPKTPFPTTAKRQVGSLESPDLQYDDLNAISTAMHT